MAISDAVSVFLGTGTVNRQPASGVEEKINAVLKDATTDPISVYDGTTTIRIFLGTDRTMEDQQSAYLVGVDVQNMHIMIDNSVYLRKEGTDDRVYVAGVQTNS